LGVCWFVVPGVFNARTMVIYQGVWRLGVSVPIKGPIRIQGDDCSWLGGDRLCKLSKKTTQKYTDTAWYSVFHGWCK